MRPKRLLHLSVSQKRDSRAGVCVHARHTFTQSRRAFGVYMMPMNFFDTGVPHGQRNTSVATGLLSNTAIRRTVAFYGLLSEEADARRANHDSYVYKPVYGHAPCGLVSRICAESPCVGMRIHPSLCTSNVCAQGSDEFAITGAGGRWHAHLAKSGLCPCFTTAFCSKTSRYFHRKSLAVVLSLGVVP
jgi:hypothetical protein